jgi:hypothetical protein
LLFPVFVYLNLKIEFLKDYLDKQKDEFHTTEFVKTYVDIIDDEYKNGSKSIKLKDKIKDIKW